MKRPQYDEVQHLREQLRLRIDAAAKSVAEVLHAAADLFIATSRRTADEDTGIGKAEASPVHEIMTPQQAADYLGTTVGTLSVWRCNRRYSVPFVKVGRKVCYRKADLDRFLWQRTENRGGDDPR